MSNGRCFGIPIRLGHVVGPQPGRFSGAQVEWHRMITTLCHSYCCISIIYIGNSNVELEMLWNSHSTWSCCGATACAIFGAQVEWSRMIITLGHNYCGISIIYIGNSNVEWEMLGNSHSIWSCCGATACAIFGGSSRMKSNENYIRP